MHDFPTPYTGGLILSFVTLFIIFVSDFENNYLNQILSYGVLIMLAGFIDDKYTLTPGVKILTQAIPIFFLIEQGLFLRDIGIYSYIGIIELGSFAKIFTFLCCMLIVNSFNYSDGMDGILALNAAISLLFMLLLVILFGSGEGIDFFIFLIISLILFAFFNLNFLKGNKIFLGDSGSNLLGFICSFSCVYLYNVEKIQPSLVIWIIAFFVYEFLCVNINRLIYSKKVFKPGRDHIHYILKDKLSVKNNNILLIICCFNMFFNFFGLIVNIFGNNNISIFFFIVFFILFFFLRNKIFSY
tara:strand:- start:56 stop:952 length:897 start_codon:yes stop_codon:yes gene_type:complete